MSLNPLIPALDKLYQAEKQIRRAATRANAEGKVEAARDTIPVLEEAIAELRTVAGAK